MAHRPLATGWQARGRKRHLGWGRGEHGWRLGGPRVHRAFRRCTLCEEVPQEQVADRKLFVSETQLISEVGCWRLIWTGKDTTP